MKLRFGTPVSCVIPNSFRWYIGYEADISAFWCLTFSNNDLREANIFIPTYDRVQPDPNGSPLRLTQFLAGIETIALCLRHCACEDS